MTSHSNFDLRYRNVKHVTGNVFYILPMTGYTCDVPINVRGGQGVGCWIDAIRSGGNESAV